MSDQPQAQHRLSVPLYDALWDAISGGQPNYVQQHERVCAILAEELALRAAAEQAPRDGHTGACAATNATDGESRPHTNTSPHTGAQAYDPQPWHGPAPDEDHLHDPGPTPAHEPLPVHLLSVAVLPDDPLLAQPYGPYDPELLRMWPETQLHHGIRTLTERDPRWLHHLVRQMGRIDPTWLRSVIRDAARTEGEPRP